MRLTIEEALEILQDEVSSANPLMYYHQALIALGGINTTLSSMESLKKYSDNPSFTGFGDFTCDPVEELMDLTGKGREEVTEAYYEANNHRYRELALLGI